jgi:hypothetical protein
MHPLWFSTKEQVNTVMKPGVSYSGRKLFVYLTTYEEHGPWRMEVIS